jgi:hypothetical protein
MSLTHVERVDRGLRLWRVRVARAAELAPTTVLTALSAIAVLLAHRLSAGRGRGSVLAARPVEERGSRQPARADETVVRTAA